MEDFLARFERLRQERLQADRSFPIAGETLTHKASVSPEVAMRLEQARKDVAAQLDAAQALMRELEKRTREANGDGPNLEGLDLNVLREMRTDETMIQAADETILACLEPDSHEAWARLRAPDAPYPLNFDEIMALADYLLGRVTGVPTVAPAGSSAGRTTTGKGSTGRSSSRAKTRTG